jgi:hypothetical protein
MSKGVIKMELTTLGLCGVIGMVSLGFFMNKHKLSSFSQLKHNPGSIKQMPYFEKLVDKCTEEYYLLI